MSQKLLSISFLVAVAACGPMNDMKDMKKTTQEMKDTTEKMKTTTDDTLKAIHTSIPLQRAGGDANLRGVGSFDAILAATDFKRKAAASAAWQQSFDFQASTFVGQDNETYRDKKLYYPAVREFYWTVSGPLFDNSLNTRTSMAAVGATLHETFYLQDSPTSFFDLIQRAAAKWTGYKNKTVGQKDFKNYENFIVKEMPTTLGLLKMRLEGLVIVIFGGFMGLEQSSSPTIQIWWTNTFFRKEWSPNVGNVDNNPFQVSFYEDALNCADKTMELLGTIESKLSTKEREKYSHEIKSEILGAAKKMKLDNSKINLNAEERDQLVHVVNRFQNLLGRIEATSAQNQDATPVHRSEATEETQTLPYPLATGDQNEVAPTTFGWLTDWLKHDETAKEGPQTSRK